MALTLAIGFLVDDAIVFLENTVRRMEQLGETPMRAAINSASAISFTILSMTLSLAAVFLPLVFMSGLVGRIFREFAITIVVSILASGIVSLTLTPLMCARLLGQRGAGAKKSWVERVIGGIEHRVLDVYGRSLWVFLRHRWVSLVIWMICLGGTAWLFYAVPKSFLPVGDSSFTWGFLIGEEGASPALMRQYQDVADTVLHENDSVDMTFTMTGNGQFISANWGLLLGFLKDPKDRPPLTMLGSDFKPVTIQHPTIQQVSAALQQQLSMRMPGTMAVFTPQPVLQISTGAAARSSGQFSYSLSGIKPDEVYDASQKLVQRLSEQQGKIFATIISDLYVHTPNLKINILRDRAKMYDVSATTIETLIKNSYSQNYVYLIKKADDQYQVILEVRDQERMNPEDLQQLYVRSDDGKRVIPLTAVATWEPILGPQAVNHLNQFTSVTLNFNLVPGVPIGKATDFIEQTAKQVVPQQIRGDFQGEALTFRQTISSLSILMVLAVFVMYVILAVLYESYLHPVTVLSTLPTAMVGGLLTLYLFGQEASLYAFIGLFMLMGIVKKNGIMIVDFAIHRVAQGEDAVKAIHDASMDRFRPIIMTTLAALMGAVPIAVGWGASGSSRRPLGLVIVGGLIVSQFITLYITPVIYLYLELFQEKVLDRTKFFRSSRLMHDEPVPVATLAEERGLQPVPADADGNGDSK
jgi:HAE1 family hydrophobic/amphiphilic exporter-1